MYPRIFSSNRQPAPATYWPEHSPFQEMLILIITILISALFLGILAVLIQIRLKLILMNKKGMSIRSIVKQKQTPAND